MKGVSTFCYVSIKKTDFYTSFYTNTMEKDTLYTWTSWHEPCIIYKQV